MGKLKFNLHDEWRWIVGHSWSFRMLTAAATLSGAEAALPLFMDHPPLPRRVFAVVVFLIVSLAMVARIIIQQRPPDLSEPVPAPAPEPATVVTVPAAPLPATVAAPIAAPAQAPALVPLVAQ